MNFTYTYTIEQNELDTATTQYVVTLFQEGVQIGQKTTTDKAELMNIEHECLNMPAKKVLSEQQTTELIADWFNAKQQLEHWKAHEMKLRTSIVEEKFTIGKGTQRIPLAEGWQLVIERGEDYKLNNKEGQVDKALEHFDETMSALLVTWKPDISKKTYDALPDDQKEHFNDCLEIKPSSPQVKLDPPKASKG